MNETPKRWPIAPSGLISGKNSDKAIEDPHMLAGVQEYLAAMESGQKPNRQEFLARYPEIATGQVFLCDRLRRAPPPVILRQRVS
jgi:hypothetical protein